MERDDALRILDQVIAAGYACEIRATNVREPSGAHYEVGVPAGGHSRINTLRVLQEIADTNGADTYLAVDSSPQVRAYLVISSPKRRPEVTVATLPDEDQPPAEGIEL